VGLLNELNLPFEDNLIICFRENSNISDQILEMIHLVEQLKDVLYGIIERH